MEKMFMAIVPGDVPTFRATLAGMPRVNIDHSDTALGGFIFDKVTELPEGPGVLNLALLFGCSNAVADVFQVFHYDNVSGLTGLDNRLANPVVEVGHPSPLFAREQFQSAFCRLCAFGLQRLPQFRVVLPDVHSLSPRKLQTVGRSGEVVNAAVNTNNVSAFWWKRNFAVNNNMDVEFLGSAVVTQCSSSRFLSSE